MLDGGGWVSSPHPLPYPSSCLSFMITPFVKLFSLSSLPLHENSRWRLNFLRSERTLEKISPTLQATCKRVYLFWCILRAIYIETSGSTVEKKCCLIRNLTYNLEWNAMKNVVSSYDLNTCTFFQQADQHQDLGVRERGLGEGGEYSMICWAGVSSVTKEPLAFATPCSAAILPP